MFTIISCGIITGLITCDAFNPCFHPSVFWNLVHNKDYGVGNKKIRNISFLRQSRGTDDGQSLTNIDNHHQYQSDARDELKGRLMKLISSTPSNAPTSGTLTKNILGIVRQLESGCPTSDVDVLPKLGGNWELLWTAQVNDKEKAKKVIMFRREKTILFCFVFSLTLPLFLAVLISIKRIVTVRNGHSGHFLHGSSK